MNKYEKYIMNNSNNTNTSINFIVDSLNKTELELMKKIDTKSKEKIKKKLFSEKIKRYPQIEFYSKKPHNKLESFILSSNKKYSKYNKVPHQRNNLSNLNINKNIGTFHPERQSDINFYKNYNSNTYKSVLYESGDSKSTKTIKNSNSFKKSAKIYENKFTINKFLKNKIYNNSSYKKNTNANPKIKIQINEKKFNSFKKVPNNAKIKLKEKNQDDIIENYFILNNNNSNFNQIDNSQLLYVIDDEQSNIYQNINNPKKYSNSNDYDLIINNKENNIDISSFELLRLNERKWIDELNELSNILIEKRENMNDNIYNKYIHKIVKLHEHFNWLINSISKYFNKMIFDNNWDNELLNYNNLDLPRAEYIWFKGFKWKGLFLRVVPQDKSKFIINEIKALNYFFLDYLQIIDKYKYSQNKKKLLSNYIIFPLISYAEINGFILYASSLINLQNNLEHEQSLFVCLDEIIKENGGKLRIYSTLNNLSYYISFSKNKNYNNENNSTKSFINLMEKYYDIKDLNCSKLFSNLNKYHFLKFQKEKYLIFNVSEFIPNLFELKIGSFIKINIFSILNNKREFYSIKYNLQIKKINEKEKNDDNNSKLTLMNIINNIYKMDINLSFKKKDIILCGIHFRIIYEAQHINNKNYKNKDFVDYLFNYDINSSNKNNFNNKYETYVVEPYVILYDLIESVKLQYSLIKHNINIKNNEKDNLFFFNSNYFSFFLSWCKMINNYNLNIKSYSNLKQYMKQYGIYSNLKYFALFYMNNQDIIDIIKISILVKAIKFILNKKDNEKIIEKIKNEKNNLLNNSFNNNAYKNIKITRIFYAIKSILYPNEILTTGKNFMEYFYQNLVFYMNVIFIKFRLIDDYLFLGILNSNDNKNEKFLNFEEYTNPKIFLKNIIKTARKKPFLFIKELESKLNFIVNPFILFKSSLSIESMHKKLDIEHISLNLNNIIHSYVKVDEISGIILAKAIFNYEYIENKLNCKNLANKSIKFEQYDVDENHNLDSLQFNNINVNNENYIDNESHNSTYDSRKYDIIDYDLAFITSKINISDSLAVSQKNNEEKNIIKNENNPPKFNHILNDFIIQLPPNCYKMKYNYENLEESSLLINKLKKSKEYQIYRNFKIFYQISDKKIIDNWIESNEIIFNNAISCNGNIQHILFKLYIYQLIISFFIEKSIETSNIILEKIKAIYKNGAGYIFPLNDLAILNIFEGLINEKNNDLSEAEKESFYSKSLMLLLLNYGEPRGRNNDSHEILLLPIWKIINKLYDKEKETVIIDYFKELFLSLEFIQENKSGENLVNKNIEENELFHESDNKNNLDKILNNYYQKEASNDANLLLDSLNFDSNIINKIKTKDKNKKQIETNNELLLNKNLKINEYFLNHSVFNNLILNKISYNNYSYSSIDMFDSSNINILNKNENQFYSKEFILYFIKLIQNLLSFNEIIFGQKYINEFISNDLLYPLKNSKNANISYKKNNIPYHLIKSKSHKGLLIAKTDIKEKKENNKLNFKNNSEENIKKTNSSIYKIFSHFLYSELIQKLSYKLNAPSGVIISFGNNSYYETGLDKNYKITSPHIIYKLKNEIINHIYAGWEHSIALTNDGEIYSFGHNQFSQCGLPNLEKGQECVKDPKNISKLNNNIKAISASCGNEHTLILSKEHIVYSFGNNEDGILGINNNEKENNNIKDYKFNKIDFGDYTNKIIEISSGTVHNLALTYDGKVFAWGSSQGGQLGLPLEELEVIPGFKNNYYIPTPINIPIKNNSINISNENNEINIIKISCGEAHSLALSNDGKVYSWGFGSNGQLGLGFCEDSFEPGEGLKNSMRYSPERIEKIKDENICDIKCGKTFSMFINNKGELFACGVNDLNQLGIQDLPPKDHLFNKSEEMCYDFIFPTKVDYFLNMKVEHISCGEGHCLAVIKDMLSNIQTIWSWGNNKFGQLGQGTFIKKCLPRPINCLFEYNSHKFDEVACGGFHSLCLIKHKDNIDWINEDYEKIICIIIDDIGIIQ